MPSPAPSLPSPRDIEGAARLLGDRVHHTPLLTSRTLGEATGARVLLKCENLQRTGSFKFRGALHALLRAREAGSLGRAGVITYSSGNHGQAVALAAKLLGIPATVVAPEDVAEVKRRAIEGYGGRVVRCGWTSEDRRARAVDLARESGASIIPPFDHPDIIAGQGTVGLEILADLPAVDAILVPVGGGGLVAGIALAAADRPEVRVWGVEPETADAMARSLEAGHRVTLPGPSPTVADGLRPVSPGELTWQAARDHAEGVLLVTDDEILAARRLLLERAKLLVETSGAATTAALLREADRFRGHTVVVVLSGGNSEVPEGF